MYKDQKPYLSLLLIKYRELNNYTQQFVADKIGVTRSAYTYYETGKTQPSLETLSLLKKLLNIPTEEIFPKESSKNVSVLSDSSRHRFSYDDLPEKPVVKSAMAELTEDEKQLVANYRLASSTLKRKARNILDPEYQELKKKKS